MLTCQDMVVVKDSKGGVIATKNYDRVYLSHAEGDDVTSQDVTADGKVVGTKERPDGPSKTDSQQLFRDAVEYVQQQHPKSDSLIVVLENTEYGLDLRVRAGIRSQLVPPKEIDADKAVQKMAKTLMSLNRELSLDQAIDLVRGIAS